MNRLPGRLGTLTAEDIMTEKVVMVREDDLLTEAAQIFQKHHISGAPVVDARGLPMGVLSLSDLLGTLTGDEEHMSSTQRPAEPIDFSRLFADPSRLPANERVRARMSRRLVSVTRPAPLVEVARVMCDGHWHRVAVVEPGGQLCGIISTMDILAALVNVADEAQRKPADSLDS